MLSGYSLEMMIFGDSIVADLTPGVFSRAVAFSKFKPSFSPDGGGLPYIEVKNHAVGGNNVDMVHAKFFRECRLDKPDIVLLNGGTNDLYGWGTTISTFMLAWKNMLDHSRDNDIVSVCLGIVPSSLFTNDQMQKRDKWNASLKILVDKYENAIFADADKYVGRHRITGDAGNLWDIRDEYNVDGVHYNTSGSIAIAHSVLDAMAELEFSEE